MPARRNRLRLLVIPVLLWIGRPLAGQQPVQSVIGTVRDTAGAPISGAHVTLGSRQTETNERGIFRVDSLRPGQYAISVRLLGYTPIHSRVGVVAEEPTELEYYLVHAPTLLPPTVVAVRRTGIYGVVGDTSYRKAVGARVQLLGGSSEVQTDSAGRFAFPGFSQGEYVVRVIYPGYEERRVPVTLKHGEGRELVVLLTPGGSKPSVREDIAARDLGSRLAFGIRQEHMTAGQLARYGSGGVCDIPEIKSRVGRETMLILNGTAVYANWPIEAVCSWRADEVELVEFGPNVCRERTHTLSELVGSWCGVNVPRTPSINSRGSTGLPTPPSYVVIWEKR